MRLRGGILLAALGIHRIAPLATADVVLILFNALQKGLEGSSARAHLIVNGPLRLRERLLALTAAKQLVCYVESAIRLVDTGK